MENQYLVGNHSKLLEPWDANIPFQELVQRLQEIQQFTNNGGWTIADEDIVDTIYTLVYNTGLLYDDCNIWDDKQRDEKPGQTSRRTSRQHSGITRKNRKFQLKQGGTT